jgi:hypothetical protein
MAQTPRAAFRARASRQQDHQKIPDSAETLRVAERIIEPSERDPQRVRSTVLASFGAQDIPGSPKLEEDECAGWT